MWPRSLLGKISSPQTQKLTAGELKVELDAEIAREKISRMMLAMEDRGGIEEFIAAMSAKQTLFAELLDRQRLAELTQDELHVLIDTMFTARRNLMNGLAGISHENLVAGMQALLFAERSVEERLTEFVALSMLGDQDRSAKRKSQRAMWDFAAEMLHFVNPTAMPLMTRWVWDAKVQSGAMREFIRGGDSMSEIAIGATADQFEAGRVWLVARLEEQGFYRDIPLMVDLVFAQAYTDYFLGMSKGLGMFDSQFGGKLEPIDFIVRLLGISPARKDGKTRVKSSVSNITLQ